MKLTVENSWEFLTFCAGGHQLAELYRVRINGTEYDVTHRQVSVPYYDRGSQWQSTSRHYFIKTVVLGVVTEISLVEYFKKVHIEAIIYKLLK